MSELYSNLTGQELDRGEAVDDGLLFNLISGLGAVKIGNLARKVIGNGLKRKERYQEALNIREKSKVWGVPYRSASGNPKKAIEILVKEQKGFVPNADGKGLDIPWGIYTAPSIPNKKGGGFGLKHSIERRKAEGLNSEKLINELPEVIKNGIKFYKENHPGRYYKELGDVEAAIRTDYNGKPWEWLGSVYFKKPK